MKEERYTCITTYLDMHDCSMNANLKAVFDCFIDKSLLKCLVVNDNVNNVKLSYDVIFYVTLFVAAIFISPVFSDSLALLVKKGNVFTRM